MKAFYYALVLSSVALAGCSSSSDTTTGKRIVLETKIVTEPPATQAFSNSQGWSISLRKISLSVGPLYYFDGATIFSYAAPKRKTPLDRVEEFLGIGVAYAHPGHYIPGNAKGQMLSPTSVDLSSGALPLPVGDGVSGIVRSATFSYNVPPTGPQASALGSHVAVLEGTATKGSDSRVFRAEIDEADVRNTKNAAAVEGCPFAETDMEGDGVVTLTIKLPLWFDQVEFDSIPASTDGNPVSMPAEAIGRNELVRGMKAGDGYVFSYSEK
ncbi:hypothetical protein LVJ94_14580 [Pendulispora rubella]|uniref:Lipoprotein n=1 Tax=Pendulispora rubella TaxID=2741070 RepID=A0ABZ2LEZ7_9BACT